MLRERLARLDAVSSSGRDRVWFLERLKELGYECAEIIDITLSVFMTQ